MSATAAVDAPLHPACGPAVEPAATSAPTSPKCSTGTRVSRQRTRKKTKGRVHWDEQVIEEHNKERGTRQKIDEPDTPFVRSPQTASDSEGGPASSDDEHRLSVRTPPKTGPGTAAPPVPPEQEQPLGDADPLALAASRLDSWVRSGGNHYSRSSTSSVASSDGLEADVECSRLSSACSSRSSSSAPLGRHTSDAPRAQDTQTSGCPRSRESRRISLSEDSLQPKPASDSFKAKRAQHYNEVAAMKAFKRNDSEESSLESDTSDEQEQTTTKTNTNTNINQTVSKSVGARPRHSAEVLTLVRGQQKETKDREPRVSFSGESGGESSEEFRNLRHSHYIHEWRRDPSVTATVSSLETNTNTNLNAGSGTEVCRKARENRAKNPMEASRPPVKFDADSSDNALSSDDFRAKRQEHYDEVTAVRRFKLELRDELENDVESSDEGPQGDASTDALGAEVANPANPMEPREPCVAFQVGGSTASAGTADGLDGRPAAQSTADSAEWKARRQAHYSEMAAALRSMPPPSDEEEDEDDAT